MNWSLSHRADPRARRLADRHYSRRTIGSPQFVPPGTCLVLFTRGAFWVTSWPMYADHAWTNTWVCSAFRREKECDGVASDLIRDAVAATRWKWPSIPDAGMITFVDPKKVRHKRDPGFCFLRAGFVVAGETTGGHGRNPLLVLRLAPADMPPADMPLGAQTTLAECAT